MPKVSKWSSHVLTNVPLIFGQDEPRVARMALSHAKDGDDAPALTITLDREMGPLAARYQWRWDEMQRWAWATIPWEHAKILGLPNNRLYLHKFVAHAKRPTKSTVLDYCNRPRIAEDVRFRLLEPIYTNAPRNPRLERVMRLEASLAKLTTALNADREVLSVSFYDTATALLTNELILAARQRRIAIETFDVTPEDGVIDDVGDAEKKMLEAGAIDDPSENAE